MPEGRRTRRSTATDLQEQLEEARGAIGFEFLQRRLAEAQRQRDERAAKRSAMTPVQRRRDITREVITDADLKHDERYHLHSVLALCGLPYRRPPDDLGDYVREYGRNSLIVQAGYLKDPETGKMVKQGLPYGPKARLLMLHICTMALRQNSHEIEIADSISGFIRELGFAVTGGRRGTIQQFKEQLHRLAAARMQIGLWNGDRATTISSQPIESFDIWLPRDPAQKTLWSSKLYLDETFFRSLRTHALPVDIRILRAFAHSAKQIDLVLWLAYRLRTVERPYLVRWDALRDQFGAGLSRERKFRETFRDDLDAICEVIPKLPAKLEAGGVRLFPSDAERLFVAPRRLPKR